jgi:hypothetical protein
VLSNVLGDIGYLLEVYSVGAGAEDGANRRSRLGHWEGICTCHYRTGSIINERGDSDGKL